LGRATGGSRDALSAETRRTAGIYKRKLAVLGELKKALLHQAFAGGVLILMTALTRLTELTRLTGVT